MQKKIAEIEKEAHCRAESEGENYFQQWFYNNRNDAYAAAADCFCDTERNSEQHKAYCVIQGNDRQKNVCYRAFGFVLFNDHQRSRRRSGRCDIAVDDSRL